MSGKSPMSDVNWVTRGQPVARTRSSSPQSCSRRGPWLWMKCPCGMSLGKRARSTSRTSRPLRARSMAVAAPAHRAPITMASYIACLVCDPNRRWPRVSPAEVQRIAAIGSPVIRNLEITYAYSLLAADVAARTGAGRELVHVRHLGVAAGGRDDPRRGHARPADGPARRRLAAAPGADVRPLAAAARAVRPRVAARAAARPPAHAVRRGRAGLGRRRARQPQGLRGDRVRVRALARRRRPRRVRREPARRRPARRPDATSRPPSRTTPPPRPVRSSCSSPTC